MQIEAGKYYKTRDGRKTMTHTVVPKEVIGTDFGNVWLDTGKSVRGKESDRDLVALWDDTPSASSGAMREKLNSTPYDLVPYQEITDAYSRVAEFGANRYESWNWTKGLPRIQILCSLLRHTFAYLRGQDRDKDSGLLHTDHILWNAVALSHNVHWSLEDGRRVEPHREYKT